MSQAEFTNQFPPRDWADIAALSFGGATAMWAAGYVTHLPGVATPSSAVFFALIAVLVIVGWLTGRMTGRGLRGGLWVGFCIGLINLLVIGSVIGKEMRAAASQPGHTASNPLLWVLGSIGLSMAVVAGASAVGRKRAAGPAELAAEAIPGSVSEGPDGVLPYARQTPNAVSSSPWAARFVAVAAAATIFLISVGGTVTGFQAGLAVPDWPSSYGYNMFLLPLSRMTGGIYFEHSHRLFGALVGFTTVIIAIYVQLRAPRAAYKLAGWAALLMVIVQGVMGGLRVTEINIYLAIIHGVFAQLILSVLFCLATSLRPEWQALQTPEPNPSAGFERAIGITALLVVVTQSIFGALYRHLSVMLPVHLIFAAVALAVVGSFAMRCWLRFKHPRLNRAGLYLIIVLLAQLTLGFAALALRMLDEADKSGALHSARVLLTTAHQTIGAVTLATTATAFTWLVRALRPAPAYIS